MWGLPPEELKSVIGYDPDVQKNRDEARKLMEKAGFGPNKLLALKVSTRNLAVYRDPAVILIDQLKDIYIDGELDVIEAVERAGAIADDVLFPRAQETDHAATVPAENLQSLRDAGLLGLHGPADVPGGIGAHHAAARPVLEAIAGGCGATSFVWAQHHGAVRRVRAGLSARWDRTASAAPMRPPSRSISSRSRRGPRSMPARRHSRRPGSTNGGTMPATASAGSSATMMPAFRLPMPATGAASMD